MPVKVVSMDLSMSLPALVKHHESDGVEGREADVYLDAKPGHRLALCLSVSSTTWELKHSPGAQGPG